MRADWGIQRRLACVQRAQYTGLTHPHTHPYTHPKPNSRHPRPGRRALEGPVARAGGGGQDDHGRRAPRALPLLGAGRGGGPCEPAPGMVVCVFVLIRRLVGFVSCTSRAQRDQPTTIHVHIINTSRRRRPRQPQRASAMTSSGSGASCAGCGTRTCAGCWGRARALVCRFGGWWVGGLGGGLVMVCMCGGLV